MNRLFIILGIITFLVGCRKDPAPTFCDNCETHINSYSSAYFLEDAEALAYQAISEDSSHIGFNEVAINPNLTHCYLGKLSAIHSASHNSSGSLNEMLNRWGVHVGPHIIMNGMSIKFADSLGLREELLNNTGSTSDDFLNELYHDYGFKSITESWYPDQVYISSLKNHNVRYIKEQLLTSPEIVAVYLNFYFLDGPSIEHFEYVDHDIFIFGYGWGDCPSGCMSKHYWKVMVDQQCNVSLVEEYGDDLPE